jgi:Flp pilus assembly pilin Flp
MDGRAAPPVCPFHFLEMTMRSLGVRFVREEEGQDIIEYALLAAFVSIVAYALIVSIGQNVIGIYTGTRTTTSAAAATAS